MGKARKTKKQNNKEKETTKTRGRKKQKIKHDDTEEDSNSTTNLNNLSQSMDFPASARKPFIVDSMKVDSSSRRASLRSSKTKNLIEPGKADLPRCSHPQKSREHLSFTHAIRQLDDLAHQVPQGSKVESPSRYLKQVEPNLRYREIEKGGKCVAEENVDEDFLDDLIAKMREGEVGEKGVPLAEKPVDEDELESRECSLSNGQHFIQDQFEVVRARIASLKRPIETGMTDLSKSRKHSSTTHAIQQLYDLAYQVPQSSQVESPRYLKQGEPSLKHDEIGKDGNFAAEENLGDGIAEPLPEMMDEVGEMEVPLVEKPISMAPIYSLKLTEFVNNMAVGKDDEVDSQRCAMDTVEGYQVKPESKAILKQILTRHGDIAKNCTASTMELRSGLLEMICGIISQLQGKDLMQIKEDFLHHNIALVDGMKNLEVDIEWLHLLLVEMLEAKQLGEKFVTLKEKKDSNTKSIKDAESKLAECQERKRELSGNFYEVSAKFYEVSAKFREVSDLLKSTRDEEIVCKEALAKAKDESTKIAQTIKCATSKVKRFLDCAPVDLLI